MRHDNIEYKGQIKITKIHNNEQMSRLSYYQFKFIIYIILIYYHLSFTPLKHNIIDKHIYI